MIHLVKAINNVEPFKINLLFSTGESRTVDFYPKLNEWSKSTGSKYKDLMDPDYFKSVKLNNDFETIYWDNGIDFCPDTLFEWGQ